ncbi:MAG: ATPase,transcriptional regulator, luxR family [Thermoleophilia bacterium]|nr:ATPase,transcriptional regulator, luxR family [Thermoleophilia bacterium]
MDGSFVVGRDEELAAADHFLDAVPDGSRALVLEGEPGIGKTTVWRETVRRARGRGFLVLMSRPAQTESKLSFAGLGDLLTGVDDTTLDAIPAPQRNAVEIALLRREPSGPPPDERAIAVAVLSALRVAADVQPVVVAVDDAQWIDPPTAAVLEFVARRLDQEPVGFLASVRVEDERPRTFDLTIGEERRRTVRVGPLSLGSLHQMIKERLGRSFPRPTLVRIEHASRGNPFHALEIARELGAVGDPGPGGALPVPEDLRKLLKARIRRLPRETREALLVASALSEPTTALADEAALEPAVDADVVRIESDGHVVFEHPLFASAVYDGATPSRRRALHTKLASQVDDAEERAHHLAFAAVGPDETVAAALDEASEQARSRGAIEAAVALKRDAQRLTPPALADAHYRRSVDLGELLFTAGDTPAAREVLEKVAVEAQADPWRSDALALLGMVRWYDGGWEEGIRLCEQALEGMDDRVRKGRLHAQLAWMGEDIPWAAEHARAAVGLLDEHKEPGMYSEALLSRAEWELKEGRGADKKAVARGILLQESASQRERTHVPATWPRLTDDFVTARHRTEELLERARAEEDEVSVCQYLMLLAWLAWLTGNLLEADRLLDETVDLSRRAGHAIFETSVDTMRAQVDGQLGRIDEVRDAVARVVAQLEDSPSKLFEARCHEALGFLALSLREDADADREYTRADELIESTGMREPADYRFHGDHIEVVIALGQLERAAELLERLEARGLILPRPWTLAVAARCRGLLHAARGDLEAAESLLREALAHHARLEMPFELARTLLCLGRVQRRRNERKAARETLERAREIFEGLPAPLWAETAREELGRIGVRRAPEELTVNEQQVAQLAASGLTNKEIAAKLFMSRRTVEANLARVYRKLGIRSRAELGAKMAARQPV